MLRIGVQAGPSVFDELAVRLPETRRRGHLAVLEHRAVLVALAVDGQEFLAAELPGCLEDEARGIRVHILVARKRRKLVDADPVFQQEHHVFDGGVVDHFRILAVRIQFTGIPVSRS